MKYIVENINVYIRLYTKAGKELLYRDNERMAGQNFW